MKRNIKHLLLNIVEKLTFTSLFFILYSLFLTPVVYAQGFSLNKTYGFGNLTSLAEGINRLVIPAFSIAATLVFFYFIFGAFKWITSAGDKNNVAAARNMIIHAIIGFILLLAMFFIIQLLPELLKLTNFAVII